MENLNFDLLATVVVTGLAIYIAHVMYLALYNIFFHPLSSFPGPRIASSTFYWKAFVECIRNQSFCHVLEKLHIQYGEVVRIGPNELHFSNPQAYHDIYNNRNRWDKERRLYHSFNEDRSSFGFIAYEDAKHRKDVLNRSFSPAAVVVAEDLIVDKIKALCTAFESQHKSSKGSDLFLAFRCMTLDVITFLCFGKSMDAINEADFNAPIITAMDASLPVFIRFKYSEIYKSMILGCPPQLSKILSPATSGLIDLQQLLLAQIKDLSHNPENLRKLPHNLTIFHRLMDAEAYRNKTVPSPGSLYEETQALMFAGTDTTGNTIMVGTYYLLKLPEELDKLKRELLAAWPSLQGKEPSCRDLERLPFLNAVIKESLRMYSGVVSGLPRVVPPEGATICGISVPPKTIVSCGSTFVHYNAKIFPEPNKFRPERWLESPDLDNWLVSFSRGPRMCLGLNLAWAELRLTFAHIFRKFEISFVDPMPSGLPFKDGFLPHFLGTHLVADLRPILE